MKKTAVVFLSLVVVFSLVLSCAPQTQTTPVTTAPAQEANCLAW